MPLSYKRKKTLKLNRLLYEPTNQQQYSTTIQLSSSQPPTENYTTNIIISI